MAPFLFWYDLLFLFYETFSLPNIQLALINKMGVLQQKVKEVYLHGSEIPNETREYQSVHYYHQLVESLPAAIYVFSAPECRL